MTNTLLDHLYQLLVEQKALPKLCDFAHDQTLLPQTIRDIVSLSRIYIGDKKHHQDGDNEPTPNARKSPDESLSGKAQPTPWSQGQFFHAYLSYFLPLNYMRALDLLERAKAIGFLDGLGEFVDFGSGPGTISLVIEEHYRDFFSQGSAVERNHQCFNYFERLRQGIEKKSIPILSIKYKVGSLPDPFGSNTLVFFSYSLNELEQFPPWALNADHLIIMDPADRFNGRRLLQIRSFLIGNGYHIWAPCTHQLSCPMLVHSQRDWCHHRMELPKMPTWFCELQKKLPMENHHLEYSYLIASRRPPPQPLSELWRITGDLLVEKGKTRQMVCFNDQRLFLSHLNRDTNKVVDAQCTIFRRGDLVRCQNGFEIRGNEVRNGILERPS